MDMGYIFDQCADMFRMALDGGKPYALSARNGRVPVTLQFLSEKERGEARAGVLGGAEEGTRGPGITARIWAMAELPFKSPSCGRDGWLRIADDGTWCMAYDMGRREAYYIGKGTDGATGDMVSCALGQIGE